MALPTQTCLKNCPLQDGVKKFHQAPSSLPHVLSWNQRSFRPASDPDCNRVTPEKISKTLSDGSRGAMDFRFIADQPLCCQDSSREHIRNMYDQSFNRFTALFSPLICFHRARCLVLMMSALRH